MTIDELSIILKRNEPCDKYGYLNDDGALFWDLRSEILAVLDAISRNSTFITDGSDPKGGWLNDDEDDEIWDAFVAVMNKLEKL